MKIALILEGVVAEVYIEQTSPDYLYDARFKECPTHVERGWLYNYETQLFSAPPPPPPPPSISSFGRIVTVLAFRLRFSTSERVALKAASSAGTMAAASVAVSMEDILSAGYINLDHPETISGVIALEQAGLLANGRASEILAPPVYSGELLAQTRVTFNLPPIPTTEELSLNSGKGYSPAEYTAILQGN